MGRKPKVEKEVLPTMTKEELYAYLKDNHRLFTTTEMAEATAFSAQQIKTACDNCGFKPITMGERVKEYIENNQHLSLEEQAEKLDMRVDSLRHHYRVHGYDVKKAGKGVRRTPSNNVRVIASRSIRELGTLSLDAYLGPIARKYALIEDPMETINRARTQLLG